MKCSQIQLYDFIHTLLWLKIFSVLAVELERSNRSTIWGGEGENPDWDTDWGIWFESHTHRSKEVVVIWGIMMSGSRALGEG